MRKLQITSRVSSIVSEENQSFIFITHNSHSVSSCNVVLWLTEFTLIMRQKKQSSFVCCSLIPCFFTSSSSSVPCSTQPCCIVCPSAPRSLPTCWWWSSVHWWVVWFNTWGENTWSSSSSYLPAPHSLYLKPTVLNAWACPVSRPLLCYILQQKTFLLSVASLISIFLAIKHRWQLL